MQGHDLFPSAYSLVGEEALIILQELCEKWYLVS